MNNRPVAGWRVHSHPVIIAIAAAIWYLGGLGTILLLGSLFERAKYHQYIIIALGLMLSLACWFWIRKPTPMLQNSRRESLVLSSTKMYFFFSACAFLAYFALRSFLPNLAAILILYMIFLSYFIAGNYFMAWYYLRVRELFYRSHCTRCLYDISAIESPTCPECGRIVTPFETDPS